MKILNQQPIKVIKYLFNENLAKGLTNCSYASGFTFKGEIVESLKTMIITFEILYTVDDDKSNLILSADSSSEFSLHIESEEGQGEIFVSYESCCQFNFVSEGLDADRRSMTEFLAEYCKHTEAFFSEYGFAPIREKEKEMRIIQTIAADALLAIENLRENDMYEF